MRPIIVPRGGWAGPSCSSHRRLQKPTPPHTFHRLLPTWASGSFGLGMNNRGHGASTAFFTRAASPSPSTRVLLCMISTVGLG
jgi:hypothetical protein